MNCKKKAASFSRSADHFVLLIMPKLEYVTYMPLLVQSQINMYTCIKRMTTTPLVHHVPNDHA